MDFGETEDHEVVVVGGGIGGLATAVALKRVGVKAVVLERAAELRTTGAAIFLYPNAWLALDALGVAYKLNSLYPPVERGLVTDLKTKSTQQLNFSANKGYQGGPKLVHRKTLLQVLADELHPGSIRFSSKLTSIDTQFEDGYPISVLGLEDGTILRAKVVIGCDGLRSMIARKLKLSPPVHSGRAAVCGLSVYPEGHGLSLNVIQQFVDVSKRAGFVALNDKEVYWFFVCKTPPNGEGMSSEPESIRRDVAEKWAKGFPSVYLDVIQHSDLSTLSWAPLMYRYPWNVVLGTMSNENVVLVGDAMHPMTPDLGQGGCTALEDAVVLGRHIGNSICPNGKLRLSDIGKAFEKYVGERKWRVGWIIAASFLSGWIQQDGSGWWMKFQRDVFYKTVMTRIIEAIHYDCGRLPNIEDVNNEHRDVCTK